MEKKPSVYVNKIDKKLNNNEKVYFSNNDNKQMQASTRGNSKTVDQQIKEIFSSDTYIYKADVEIVTKENTLTKKLIGKNNKYLITMENELIPIEDILEIRSKNN